MIALLVAIPLAFAFATAPHKTLGRYLLPFVVLVNLFILLVLGPGHSTKLGGWEPAYGITLVLDRASYWPMVFANLFLLIVSITAEVGSFGTVLLVMNAAMNGLMLSADFFNTFVFLEVLAVTAYIVSTDRDSAFGAFKYMILGGLGGIFYLLGAVSVYVSSGSLNMAHAALFASFDPNPFWLGTALLLMLSGLLVELKVLPFGFWAPDVYSSGSSLAPTVLGSSATLAVFYLASRLNLALYDLGIPRAFVDLCLISAVVAHVAALAQKNLNRTLAFASIGSMSVLVASLLTKNDTVVAATFFYLLADIVAKFVLFTIVAHKKRILFATNYSIGVAFTIASLSLIGVPPLGGFWAKFYLLRSLFSIGEYWIPAVVLIGTVLEATYLIIWNVRMWFAETETTIGNGDAQRAEFGFLPNLVVLLMAMILVLFGIFSTNLHSAMENLAGYFFDFQTFYSLIFGG